MRKGIIIFVLLSFLTPQFLSGQEKKIDLGEVLIEGESVISSIELRKESITGKLIIPRADLLSFGYSTAGDVIKNMPLVYLDSEPGVNSNVSIGGLDREYQAILINGRKPAGGEDSRDLKLDRIPVSMIERIEIDFNSPVSNGTSGIAGMVNIILREEAFNEGLNIHLETNLNTTDPEPVYKAEADGAFNIGKTKFLSGLTYNSYQRKKETELVDSSTDIIGGIEELIVTDIFGANIAAHRDMGKYSKLKLKGFFSWFDEDEFEAASVKRRKDGTLNVRESNTENDKLRYLITSDIVYEYHKDNDMLSFQAGFSNNYEKRHKDQLQEKSEYFEEVRELEDQDNNSADIELAYTRSNIAWGKTSHTLKTGLLYSANYRNTDRINAVRPEGYMLWDVIDESYTMNENILSLFGEVSSILSPGLEILTALNYEYSSGRYETNDTTGNHSFLHLSPSLHLRYKLTDKFILNAGAARHIARPAYMSMVPVEKVKIKKDLIEVGNPDIIPSRAIAVDLGASYYFNKGSYLSVNAYYKWVRDMIEMQYTGIDETTGYNLYTFVNVNNASLYGFYVDSRIDLNPDSYNGFTLYAAYSYMGSKIKDNFTGGTKRLDNQPAHLISVKLDYLNTARKINVSSSINYNSERIIAAFTSDDNLDIAATRESAYLTFTSRIKYFFGSRGSIYLAGDNLFMHPVKIIQGSVSEKYYPGAIIRFGVTYNIAGLSGFGEN